MKKFGFGRKKDKEDKDGRSSSTSSSTRNAGPPVSDPYAIDTNKYAHYGGKPSAYEQAKQNYAPPGHGGPAQRQAPAGYAASARDPYGASSVAGSPPPAYGAPDSYSTRQETMNGNGGRSAAQSRGAGGYGGLGRVASNDTLSTQAGRDALFGDARERHQKKETGNGFPGDNKQPSGEYYNQDAADAGPSKPGYGAYSDKQLTAEEEEEEDVQATKQQIRFMKKEDVSSTRNALRIAAQAEETGRSTLARLGAQGERIHNTEKNLDLAANHNRVAEEKARQLKTLNGSMFAIHVSNPFTSSSRKAARDANILNKHQVERAEREISQRQAFQATQRMEQNFKNLQPGDPGYKSAIPSKASLAERAKYQFEADSEDDEMEDELDNNMNLLHGAAGRLHTLAKSTGTEVEAQNKHLDRITAKSEKVDDQIVMNRARLDRIH